MAICAGRRSRSKPWERPRTSGERWLSTTSTTPPTCIAQQKAADSVSVEIATPMPHPSPTNPSVQAIARPALTRGTWAGVRICSSRASSSPISSGVMQPSRTARARRTAGMSLQTIAIDRAAMMSKVVCIAISSYPASGRWRLMRHACTNAVICARHLIPSCAVPVPPDGATGVPRSNCSESGQGPTARASIGESHRRGGPGRR